MSRHTGCAKKRQTYSRRQVQEPAFGKATAGRGRHGNSSRAREAMWGLRAAFRFDGKTRAAVVVSGEAAELV